MKLRINSVHFDADQQLLDFIQKKVDKLETFYDRIVEGEVILKHNNKDGVANNTVELKLFVPGATLFSESDNTSFEASTDEAVENMRRQLKRHKDKQMAH
jgi:putative sigma-54 modulation protein